MFETLSITGMIFILIGIGYASVRLGLFSDADMGLLGKFVVNLALPPLIFRAVSSRPLAEIADTGYLGAVLFGSLTVFGLGYLWSRRISGASPQASIFRAMGMSCSNSGFVGYPVLLMALPEIAETALALNMIVENIVMIPLTLALAELARSDGRKGLRLAAKIVWRLMRSPILIALALGIAVSLSGATLPALIARPVELLASSSAAVSLVVIGGTLAALPLSSLRAPVWPVVTGKLIAHPLAVAAGLAVMATIGLGTASAELASAAIILAAMPVMGIYPILAQRFGQGRMAALATFMMTVLSFFTISATLAIVLP
ncbi:AEC family transporter [Paracoccus sediminicola]|uniref:AEC family transporter n=1 Tax=Paracoccus sediminicola TaxID=3017783 RepID=UPI0022F07A14|nr:AEC family transporter [Paracoccus sediminicola]WBU56984.1 AEC family transporter [Paracoccus sediminicola]